MVRKSPTLTGLLTKAKQEVLAATILHPDREWYLTELARHLKLAPTTVQHEVTVFVSSGILQKRKDGNRVYYKADKSCPIFGPLYEILIKTSGLVEVLREALAPIRKSIDIAFVYGSVAAERERSGSDVDLMVVGRAKPLALAGALEGVEQRLAREINPTVYTTQEFAKKVEQGHHFLTSVLKTKLLFVHGSPGDLEKLVGLRLSEDSQDKPIRTSRSSGRR